MDNLFCYRAHPKVPLKFNETPEEEPSERIEVWAFKRVAEQMNKTGQL